MPRNTRLGSFGVTLTTASGSAGSPGFVTTPSGPLNQLAVMSGPPWRFVSVCVRGVRLGRDAEVVGLEAERRGRTGGDRRRSDRAAGAGDRAAAGGHVHAEHRQAEQRRLEQRLLVDAADVRRCREVVELRLDQRLADRDRRPGAPARSCRAKLL